MNIIRQSMLIVVFCGQLLLSTLVAQDAAGDEQAHALQLVDQKATFVLRLSSPQQTIKNWATGLDAIQEGLGSAAQFMIPAQLGSQTSNPQLAGVDQTRDWHLVVLTKSGEEPRVVFVIPAADPEQLIAALPESFSTSTAGDYVLYTDRGELPEVAETSTSLDATMPEEIRQVFDSGEIGIYLNAAILRGVYSEELDQAYDRTLEALNQLRFAMAQTSEADLSAVIEVYGTFAEQAFQMINDSQSLAVSLSLDQNRIQIDELCQFGDNTKTAKRLGEFPLSPLEDIQRLPAGAFAYYGISGGMDKLMKWSSKLTTGMIQDPDEREKVESYFDQLNEVSFGSLVGNMKFQESDSGIIQAASLAKADPIDKLREFMRNSTESIQTMELPGMTQTTTIQPEAETYGDLKADLVTVEQEFTADGVQGGMKQMMSDALFGPQGMQSRVLYFDDEYLTVMGGGKAATQAAIDARNSPGNPQLAEPRKQLMEQANLIVLFDLPGGITQALRAAQPILRSMNAPIDAQMIDELQIKPSFNAIGIAAEKGSLRARTVVPVEQVRGMLQLIQVLRQMQQRPI